MGTAFDVRKGDRVIIKVRNDSDTNAEGKIFRILKTDDSGNTHVVLEDGRSGIVSSVLSKLQDVKWRIMNESQHSENKEVFGEEEMKSDVIPKSVQAFLNSEGGYLYVGIRDSGSLEERLVGIDRDLDMANTKKENLTNGELCDILHRNVLDALEKYLRSDSDLGSLVDIDFPLICGIQIMQITVKSSPHPWFFKNLSRSNKEKEFQVIFDGGVFDRRKLDDFYIRRGNAKTRLTTAEDLYNYFRVRFLNK